MAETVSLNTEDNTNKPKVDVSSIMQGVSGGAGALATAYSTYGNLAKEEDLTSRINSMYDPAFRGQEDFDSLESAYMNFSPYSHLTLQDVGFNKGQGIMNVASASMQGAGAGAAFGGWGALIGGVAGLTGGLIGYGAAQNKANKLKNRANSQIDEVNAFNARSLNNRLTNAQFGQFNTLKLNDIYAKGGPLETHGSDWSTGLNYIGAGGSHEQNPNGGIQQGIAPDGLPNLVEEGEVIWNDYVFSKRLKVPKAVRNKYKLRGNKPISFADAALEFNKEMDERPNDPISKRGRDGMLAKLADAQEEKRAKIQAKEQAQQAAMMDMMGMPQDQMAVQEPIVPEEQPVDEMGQSMPMAEGYAAKGGPIGHKYDTAGWLDNFTNWWNIRHNFDTNLANSAIGRLDNAHPELNTLYEVPGVLYRDLPTEVWNRNLEYSADGKNLSKDVMNWLAKQAERMHSSNFEFKNVPRTNAFFNDWTKFINGLDDKTVGNGTLVDQVERILAKANKGPVGDVSKGIQKLYDTYGKTGNDARMDSHINVQSPRVLSQTLLNPTTLTNPTSKYPILNAANNLNTTIQNSEVQSTKPKSTTQSDYPWQGYLRYAPAIGSALGVFSDLMGWTNKPDYSAANAIAEASKNVRDVSFRPIGDYAQYRPVDTRFALNTLNSAAGANRRGILNTSAGNRGTAMAGILASDNNYMNNIGNTLFSAENANYDRYMKALAHNTDVNKFNSEGFLKADMANQGAGEVRARYAAMAADARQKALQYASAARSANLTNLFDNLGNIGIDALNRADARWLAQYWPGSRVPSYDAAHGGRINKRRKRRII